MAVSPRILDVHVSRDGRVAVMINVAGYKFCSIIQRQRGASRSDRAR